MMSPGASCPMSPETHRLTQELAKKNGMPGMTIKVDQHPDREEDSPRHEQMSGSMLLMAGKYKGQNVTMRGAYCEDKGYLDWIRTHINEKSALPMRILKGYTEMRDQKKAVRLEREQTGLDPHAKQKQMPRVPRMPSRMMSMQNHEMETPRSSSSWSVMSGPPCQTWATPKSQGRIPNSSKRGCDHGEMEVDSKTQVVRNQAAVENWGGYAQMVIMMEEEKKELAYQNIRSVVERQPDLAAVLMTELMMTRLKE